jgi:hypothetical protein
MIDVLPAVTVSVLADNSDSVAITFANEPVVAVNVTPSVLAVSWNSIEGKPSAFPPTAHGHHSSDIDDLHRQTINGGRFVG